MTTQIALCFCTDAKQMNEKLLQFQALYPQREIINVSISSDVAGWIVAIVMFCLILLDNVGNFFK